MRNTLTVGEGKCEVAEGKGGSGEKKGFITGGHGIYYRRAWDSLLPDVNEADAFVRGGKATPSRICIGRWEVRRGEIAPTTLHAFPFLTQHQRYGEMAPAGREPISPSGRGSSTPHKILALL